MNHTIVRKAIREAKRLLGASKWREALRVLNEAKKPFCCHRLTCEQHRLYRLLVECEDLILATGGK